MGLSFSCVWHLLCSLSFLLITQIRLEVRKWEILLLHGSDLLHDGDHLILNSDKVGSQIVGDIHITLQFLKVGQSEI